MKLDDFVHESLKNIMLGVQKATKFGIENKTGIVNPGDVGIGQGANGIIFDPRSRRLIQNVEFDIAVTVTESASSTSEGAQSMGEITVSGHNTDSTKSNASISRIRFSIPIHLS
ncbi:hypothetical protein [Serratia liquefaciens]|uniref:hypothetical protein n=1 Tax=Serratia liquefaciens TaxID=614 RepID=UPI000959B998|nr:hypothetical protein [Serratia liquefaciens]OKP25458.1 hypothetical protein BSQ35_03010 [Serratia liquefaciens]